MTVPAGDGRADVGVRGNEALERLPDLPDCHWTVSNFGGEWIVILASYEHFTGATAAEAVDAALLAIAVKDEEPA